MTRINVFRSNPAHQVPTRSSIVWGKTEMQNQAGIVVFAAALIICSLTVGCSSQKPKAETSMAPSQVAQKMPAMAIPVPASTSVAEAAAKPAQRKIVHRAPASMTFTDKNSGVSFHYPRKYILKTGQAADEVASSTSVPLNFPQPGGSALATVQIPEGAYPKSDLVSAIFDVSVNKSLTAEQCGEFRTLQDNPAKRELGPQEVTNTAQTNGEVTSELTKAETSDSAAKSGLSKAEPTPSTASEQSRVADTTDKKSPPTAADSKLILGDMELKSSETLSSTPSRKEDAKYYHAFENGGCYEFALKVATTGAEPDEGGKPVDREEIFKRLEKILASVKIDPPKSSPAEAEKQTAAAPAIAPANAAQ